MLYVVTVIFPDEHNYYSSDQTAPTATLVSSDTRQLGLGAPGVEVGRLAAQRQLGRVRGGRGRRGGPCARARGGRGGAAGGRVGVEVPVQQPVAGAGAGHVGDLVGHVEVAAAVGGHKLGEVGVAHAVALEDG
eukprot:scaffold74998_cov34-Prasinocladus_malaysianus.AAC.2